MGAPGLSEAHHDAPGRLGERLEQDQSEVLALALESLAFAVVVESAQHAEAIGPRLEAESVALSERVIWREQVLATLDVGEVVILSGSLDEQEDGLLLAQVLTSVLLDRR